MSIKLIKDTFEEIHNSGKWLCKDPERETSCGKGSKINNNKKLIKEIPILLQRYSIKEIVDIGCGDVNWIRYLFNYFAKKNITYTGIDVSETIIEKAKLKTEDILHERYKKTSQINFLTGTIEHIPISYNERLIISKDVFVHLPNKIIIETINECSKKANYILTTNFPNTGINRDIELGDWRAIDLTKEPFFLEQPIEIISNPDKSTKHIFPDKNMSLFKLEKSTNI